MASNCFKLTAPSNFRATPSPPPATQLSGTGLSQPPASLPSLPPALSLQDKTLTREPEGRAWAHVSAGPHLNLSGTTYKRQPSVTEKRKTGCEPPKMEPEGEAYCLAGNRVSTDQAGGRRRRGEEDWEEPQSKGGKVALSKVREAQGPWLSCWQARSGFSWRWPKLQVVWACVRPRRTVAPAPRTVGEAVRANCLPGHLASSLNLSFLICKVE